MQNDHITKVAIIDLYNNAPNQGMRCVKEIIEQLSGSIAEQTLEYHIFETRYKNELPKAEDFDIYVSTGGPGSPFDGEGLAWEANYFKLLDTLWAHNQNINDSKKYFFFICHSFQMMCRYFKLGEITQRKSTSFGIFPIHKTHAAASDEIFGEMPEPYYAVDSRDWQVVQPDYKQFKEIRATLLALEKARPHVELERAMMAIRISNEFIGTQFHPEADPVGMSMYFKQEDKKKQIIENHGEQKYTEMITHLNDPDKILLTYSTVLPRFLSNAIMQLSDGVYV